MSPNCPICNTNLYVHKINDYSTYASGWDRDKTRITNYFSDVFECKLCKGIIHYSEEQMNDEPMFIEISYRKQNYIPNVRTISHEQVSTNDDAKRNRGGTIIDESFKETV